MAVCSINTDPYTIYSTKKQIREQINPISWLDTQDLYPKVFFREKNKQTIRAAVGSVLDFSSAPKLKDNNPLDLCLYGGMRFFPQSSPTGLWNAFPSSRFWLPARELICEEGEATLSSYSLTPQASAPSIEISSTKTADLHSSPSFPCWEGQIEKALQSIQSGQLQKVVLARRQSVDLSSSVSSLLEHLQPLHPFATLFAFQFGPEEVFIGATPEKLFERKEENIYVEAIAGTKERSSQDEKSARELLENPKESQEFLLVKQFLEERLSPLCSQVSWHKQDQILKTAHLLHRYNRLQGHLFSSCSDEQLLSLLHPTPALGGYPQAQALSFIQEHESFDRGWYGAPIGFIRSQESQFYVAIRSALVQKNRAHIFTGVGIVEGSDALSEWEELNAKARWFQPSSPG